VVWKEWNGEDQGFPTKSERDRCRKKGWGVGVKEPKSLRIGRDWFAFHDKGRNGQNLKKRVHRPGAGSSLGGGKKRSSSITWTRRGDS